MHARRAVPVDPVSVQRDANVSRSPLPEKRVPSRGRQAGKGGAVAQQQVGACRACRPTSTSRSAVMRAARQRRACRSRCPRARRCARCSGRSAAALARLELAHLAARADVGAVVPGRASGRCSRACSWRRSCSRRRTRRQPAGLARAPVEVRAAPPGSARRAPGGSPSLANVTASGGSIQSIPGASRRRLEGDRLAGGVVGRRARTGSAAAPHRLSTRS